MTIEITMNRCKEIQELYSRGSTDNIKSLVMSVEGDSLYMTVDRIGLGITEYKIVDDDKPKRNFFNDLGFVTDSHDGEKIAVLADEHGKRIPGQCAIKIDEPDRNNVRMVTVVFEVMADVPEGCAMSVNWKE